MRLFWRDAVDAAQFIEASLQQRPIRSAPLAVGYAGMVAFSLFCTIGDWCSLGASEAYLRDARSADPTFACYHVLALLAQGREREAAELLGADTSASAGTGTGPQFLPAARLLFAAAGSSHSTRSACAATICRLDRTACIAGYALPYLEGAPLVATLLRRLDADFASLPLWRALRGALCGRGDDFVALMHSQLDFPAVFLGWDYLLRRVPISGPVSRICRQICRAYSSGRQSGPPA